MKMKQIMFAVLLMLAASGCSRSDSLPNQADSAQQTTVSQPEVSQNEDVSAIQQNTENLMKLPEIYASLHNQTEAVKQKHYPNLTFSDGFSVHMPDSLHEVCRLRLTNKPEIPREECFALFDRLFNDAFSDYYGENDKKEQYRIWSNDLERDPTQKPPFDLPAYYDHETDFLSQKISVLQLVANTPHGYLAVEPKQRRFRKKQNGDDNQQHIHHVKRSVDSMKRTMTKKLAAVFRRTSHCEFC